MNNAMPETSLPNVGPSTVLSGSPLRPVERRGMVGSGERLISRSGRAMAPVPRLAQGSNRAVYNTLLRLHGWLLDEARAEALVQGHRFHATLLKGMHPKKLSPSDVETLNLMLFDHEYGPGPEHRVSSLTTGVAPAV